MNIDDIQTIFLQECDEGLAAAEAGLLECRAGTHDEETINTIFRAVHSIKGGAGAFGFDALQSFTHEFETVLDQVRGHEVPLTLTLVDLLLRAFDLLSDHAAAIRGGGDTPDDAEVREALQAVSAEAAAPVAAAPAPADDGLGFSLDDLLGDLAVPEPDPDAWMEQPPAPAAPEPSPEPEPQPAPVAVLPVARVPAPARPAPERRAAADVSTIRVDLDKLDRLVNIVGELVITQAMLTQRLADHGISVIDEVTSLEHLTRELQDSAMSIRAQPIGSVFGRVPRIVRELEGQTGKRVRLETEGEATELDKTIVERIGDPLTHLIRNAVDHGLETPEERRGAGKPEEGVVRLSAEHRGGRILICVSDDGRGIDRARVLAKAVERGLVAADAKLADEEIDNLIFAPGFSTVAEVSAISGRGVGMDVVRQNVQALGGRISIASRPGEGSTFTLALPLTLAILDGMIVSVGAETFVIPLTHIIESLRPLPADLSPMGRDQRLLNVRGTFLPVQPVARRLGVDGAVAEPTEAVLIVVESETAGPAVLMVDAIVDQRQVVIKSLETNYRPVDGIAGATILGDGRVALILDVEGLVAQRAGFAVEALAA